jgi:hypothetical protein
LFHIVPEVTCGNANVEKNNQIASAVFTQRNHGTYIAMMPAATINRPTIHVFVADDVVCGQTHAEMNSQTPSAMFSPRAQEFDVAIDGPPVVD